MITRDTTFAELAAILPPGRLLTDPVALMTYEGDASLDRGAPDAVALPGDAAEVARVVAWAARRGVPIVARGAGTGLSGGAVAERGGLIVEFSRMDALRELDPAGRSAVVEPGLINLTLDAAAKARGLYYPPDPASGRASTLGGNLAENAGGPHCFKYGVTSNYVTGLDVVLASGKTVRLGGAALDYPEYDLAGLLVGSEGTLGLITSATVRLLRNPPAVKTMMAAFDSVEAAGEAVSAVIAAGLVPATLEMMNQAMMRIIEAFVPAGLPLAAGAALIVEADGYPASVGPQMDEIAAALRSSGGFDLRVAKTAEERDRIWYGRKSAAGAMARIAPAYYLVDGTVPRSKLAATLHGVNRLCDDAGFEVAYVFHAGDGNLHPFIPIANPRDRALVARVVDVGRAILELCVANGGSITGEHGVGIEKRAFMPLMYSADELDVMRAIRRVFDPGALLNPGKIFPPVETQHAAQANGVAPRSANGGAPRSAIAANPRSPIPDPPSPIPHPPSPIPHPPSPIPHPHPPSPNPRSPLAPATPAEAAALLHEATAAGLSVRIRGMGTKSAALPPADVCVSTAGLRGVLECARDDLYVTVGAGTPVAALSEELAAQGMWAPLASPWPEATVGGIVAANANGPLRMRYGGARDLLLAATVALPDGRVIRAGRPVVKNVAGYDLPKLYVGSRGTLGLLADVTLKLAPLPRARASLSAEFASLDAALACGSRLLPLCLTASALLVLGPQAGAYRLVYTAEGHPADVAAELAEARALIALVAPAAEAPDLSGSDLWAGWVARAAADGGALLQAGVPPAALPTLAMAAADAAGLLADLANGQLFVHRPVAPAPLRHLAAAAHGYAVALAPGDSPALAEDPWGHTPDAVALMRALRHELGAGGLLNPGAFVV
jgi:D-lactate dehydrogenase (cytochrome)